MDFFGAMGGVSKVLINIAGIFYGGYSKFWSTFSTNGLLYKVKSNKEIFKKSKMQMGKDNLQEMVLPLYTRLILFLHLSCLAPFLKCFRTKKHK